jgi:hypothetical protein
MPRKGLDASLPGEKTTAAAADREANHDDTPEEESMSAKIIHLAAHHTRRERARTQRELAELQAARDALKRARVAIRLAAARLR